MAQQLSAHLRNVGILLIAAVLALAADRYARGDSRTASMRNTVSAEDLARFVMPFAYEPIAPRSVLVGVDPFGGASLSALPADSPDVEGPGATPRRGSRLTAILVADNSRVAVIDDATVSVGDILRDGSRVSSIQQDRVWLVDRNGQWRMLSLASSRQ